MSKETCEDCGRPLDAHNLVDILECIYSGKETKTGRPFGRKDAEEVAERMIARLES